MTTTSIIPRPTMPPDPVPFGFEPFTADSDLSTQLVERARAVGPLLAAGAESHDRLGTWVADSFELVRRAGLLAIGVPPELGGAGATISQIVAVQRELARHCASTALASSMHQHVTAFTAWRHRRGLPGAEATLRRVASEGIVLGSTGGRDLTNPHGSALRVDGGYRVSGRKAFVSQAPAASVLSTMFTFDDPERGLRVLNMAVPMASPGVRVVETWDASGMRGTGSHDVELVDVFVPDERVLADRPHGVFDPPLQVIFTIAFSIISGVYLGIADGVIDEAAREMRARGRLDDPGVQRQIGLMVTRRQVADWALDGALRRAGDDPSPSMATMTAVLVAKREVALAGTEICDLATDLVGGRAYFRGSPIERATRDMRAARLHPLGIADTLGLAGRVEMGLP